MSGIRVRERLPLRPGPNKFKFRRRAGPARRRGGGRVNLSPTAGGIVTRIQIRTQAARN